MVATIPDSIYRSSLDGYIHTLDLDYCILCYGWLRPCHIYHVFEISVILLYVGFLTAVFSIGHVLVNNFTPPSLSGLMLYGASITQQFVTVPAIPHPAHWRAHSVTYEQ